MRIGSALRVCAHRFGVALLRVGAPVRRGARASVRIRLCVQVRTGSAWRLCACAHRRGVELVRTRSLQLGVAFVRVCDSGAACNWRACQKTR